MDLNKPIGLTKVAAKIISKSFNVSINNSSKITVDITQNTGEKLINVLNLLASNNKTSVIKGQKGVDFGTIPNMLGALNQDTIAAYKALPRKFKPGKEIQYTDEYKYLCAIADNCKDKAKRFEAREILERRAEYHKLPKTELAKIRMMNNKLASIVTGPKYIGSPIEESAKTFTEKSEFIADRSSLQYSSTVAKMQSAKEKTEAMKMELYDFFLVKGNGDFAAKIDEFSPSEIQKLHRMMKTGEKLKYGWWYKYDIFDVVGGSTHKVLAEGTLVK